MELKAMCEDIANELTEPELFAKVLKLEEREDEDHANAWLDDALDIEWTTYRDKSYKGASVLVAFGGPNIWVDFTDKVVKGFWGDERVEVNFVDNLGVEDYLVEMFNN